MPKLKNALNCWCGSGIPVWDCLVTWRGDYHMKRGEVLYGDGMPDVVAWFFCGQCRDFTRVGGLAEAKSAAEKCARAHGTHLIYRG